MTDLGDIWGVPGSDSHKVEEKSEKIDQEEPTRSPDVDIVTQTSFVSQEQVTLAQLMLEL